MIQTFSFPCNNCRSKIKAPIQLIGQHRNCPSCAVTILVPNPSNNSREKLVRIPQDVGPLLVADD